LVSTQAVTRHIPAAAIALHVTI